MSPEVSEVVVDAMVTRAGYDPGKVRQMGRDLFENWRCEAEEDGHHARWDGLPEATKRGWYRAALFAMAYARLGGGS